MSRYTVEVRFTSFNYKTGRLRYPVNLQYDSLRIDSEIVVKYINDALRKVEKSEIKEGPVFVLFRHNDTGSVAQTWSAYIEIPPQPSYKITLGEKGK